VSVYYVVTSELDSSNDVGAHGAICVALGAKRSASGRTSVPQMCILCQEEQDLTLTGRSLVLCAYIQRYNKRQQTCYFSLDSIRFSVEFFSIWTVHYCISFILLVWLGKLMLCRAGKLVRKNLGFWFFLKTC